MSRFKSYNMSNMKARDVLNLQSAIKAMGFKEDEYKIVHFGSHDIELKVKSQELIELVLELERVSARDAQLEEVMASVISLTAQDFTEMESLTASMTTAVESLALSTAQKLDDMLLFVNEYNAIGMALTATRDKMQAITSTVGDELTLLGEAQIGYQN